MSGRIAAAKTNRIDARLPWTRAPAVHASAAARREPGTVVTGR
jgi:hypothetical protein